MANTNTFLEDRWSRPNSSTCGLYNMWYQSKSLGRPPRKSLHYGFIQRQLKREKEARLGNCIRQITHDCKDMLRRKLEEIELYNSTISQNRNRKQKCYKCRQRGYIIKNCPMKKKEHNEGTKMAGNTSILMKGQESAKLVNKEIMTTKPTVSLKYPEWIHFSTKCMIKGTDQGHWDDSWYIGREVKNGDQGYLIPGVHYAPEVTLNILSIEQLERQGFNIFYEDNTCRLSYMFSNPNDHKLNEDKLRVMQNEFLENYFDSLEKGDTTGMKTDGMLSMDNDLIEIKGTTYSTKILVTIHLMDLYKLVESFGGYLSVYFARDFGKGKEYTCHASHQCDFVEIQAPNMEAANRKGKEKIEHFGIILEDARKEADSHQLQPISPNIKKSQTMNKDLQGMIKRPMNSDKEDTNSSSSEDFTIIT
ncbi:ARID DNA-binding domain-containing protein [Tanacetum coccineum]